MQIKYNIHHSNNKKVITINTCETAFKCETWQLNLGYSLPLSVSFNYNSITSPIWISPYGHSAIPWLHKHSGMEYLASAEGRGRKLKAVFFLCLVEVDWFFVNKVMCNDTGFSYQLSCRDSQWARVQYRAVLLLQRLFFLWGCCFILEAERR